MASSFPAPTAPFAGAAIPAAVLAQNDYMVSLRREFHAHPELSFQEHRTAARVAAALRALPGVTGVVEGVGRTGVVAQIVGALGAGPCLALRADMDALPLQETGDCPFISQAPSVMHACGHDGHMAALLGAAAVLGAARARLRGSVKLLFQPAEEGFGGAREMIKDGVLEASERLGPRVDEVFGAHLWTYQALGTVGARKGAMMAGSDKFTVTVKGKGGHGAAPQSTVDAVVVASSLVMALQTVVSRSVDPLEPAVLTCGTINGGFGYNIIADEVVIGGTTRCFAPAVQETIKARMACLCAGMGASFGAEVALNYQHGYPPTVNSDAVCLEALYEAAQGVVGRERVLTDVVTCGAEDFSYFLNERPGVFFFVGAALPGELRPHHKSGACARGRAHRWRRFLFFLTSPLHPSAASLQSLTSTKTRSQSLLRALSTLCLPSSAEILWSYCN